ncbi:hypothetical protein PF005_g20257 [Phytophthora fragariae]|uniref:Uncharacterized protein n=1 Tax=Phytophthora fragariae TaxID=53985 RepID=A0A6A3SW18_9STRA|nr:hypothetical protein PF003_g38173 [Phytophthora fragariae]KAE8934681.1 hypothetical protein PF009_g15349 [Phytophthora fragariae]KAE8987353.1 hypothetical protein PF011_g19615 [Phytophthora fragariae]KAE9078803.1 hypothetical protein PF010_g23003 [Phytophthora fragariae]KAE9093383.1 hypothetical protein PF007_g18148 [Phytophthora fragariae]
MNERLELNGGELDSDNQSWEDDGSECWYDGGDSEKNVSSDYRPYTLRLMDTQEMQALRVALNRSEVQIQQQGHMKEYVPRKPTSSSKLRRWYGLPRNRVVDRPVMSAGPTSRLESSELSSKTRVKSRSEGRPRTSSRPIASGVTTAEFARILKEETQQVRELERRYEDTKRSLLEYTEVVTSCKPNDRVGGPEIYEQLADLIAFAAQCGAAE